MTYEQKLKLEREVKLAEREAEKLAAERKAVRLNELRAKWEEARFLKECGVELLADIAGLD